MSMVPPARSMRVGADEATRTPELYRVARSFPNKPRGTIVAVMSPGALRRQIGALLIAGFDGHQVPIELKSLAREFGLGGVILFARHIVEPEQVAELAREAAELVPD